MARVSPYELGNVAAFVYEAAKGLTGRVVESTAEVSQPRPAAGQWSRRGAVTHMREGDPGRVAGLTDSPEHCTDIAGVTVPATSIGVALS